MGKQNFKKRLAKVEQELAKDKPEVKTLDVLLNPLLAAGTQNIYSDGIDTGVSRDNYDLTRGFIQGLQNDGGNIDGNYCKLTSMDLRILIQNGPDALPASTPPPVRKIRLMIVRVPNADALTPALIQAQVLAYGDPTTYGQLTYVSPLKRNSTINGGYDVMMDKIIRINNEIVNPNKSTSYIHFRKKWAKGLTLRFSGVAGGLSLEQNRIYLFAMDTDNVFAAQGANSGAKISFINRLRYSDE